MNTTTVSTSPVPVPQRRGWSARMTSRLGAFGLTAALGAGGLSTLVPMMCAPAATAPAATTEQVVVSLTNQQRAGAGRAALTINANLTAAAQAHANDQASVDTMSHTGTDGSNPGTRIQRSGYPVQAWGENVAGGYTTPSTEPILEIFTNLSRHHLLNRHGQHVQTFEPELTPQQTQVLNLLDIPTTSYTQHR